MTPDEFRKHGHDLVEWIARYLETIRDQPVLPRVEPGDLYRLLPGAAPETGEPFDAVFADFERDIIPASTHWNHPRFFSYFAVSSSPPSILAEFLMAAMNQNGLVWKSSPAVTELEHRVLGWLRDWIGLPAHFTGVIQDTASVSTLHALVAARQHAAPETRSHGARHDLVVYASDQAHSSVEKGALALGFGERNIRKIASQPGTFNMSATALEAAIQKDLAEGSVPCCVVPSIGATPTASIDPVDEVIDIAHHYGMWVHVDAAYAGPAAMLDECRWMFKGWERAHSIVLNPMKWMLVNVDLSVLYLSKPEALRDAISLTPDYLRSQQNPDVPNFNDYSVALGRRFRALKLWFTMRCYGREGVAAMLRSHNADAQWLKEQVESDPRFEIAAPVYLSLVTFRLKSSDEKAGDELNTKLVDEVNASGFAFLSQTKLAGKQTVRFAIGNFMTTRADVEATWRVIQETAAGLLSA